MINLYVFDFDKTLIPYDSFKRYLLYLIFRGRIDVGFIVFLRFCRIINSNTFKKWITDSVDKGGHLQKLSYSFSNQLADDICWPSNFLKLFKNEVNKAYVLVLSASPECYLKLIEKSNKFRMFSSVKIVGSNYVNGKYVEMYGEEKLKYLENYYSLKDYRYKYAISDSESDVCWMKLFNNYEIIN